MPLLANHNIAPYPRPLGTDNPNKAMQQMNGTEQVKWDVVEVKCEVMEVKDEVVEVKPGTEEVKCCDFLIRIESVVETDSPVQGYR